MKANDTEQHEGEAAAHSLRARYLRMMLEIRGAYDGGATGLETVRARAAGLDAIISGLWQAEVAQDPRLQHGIVLLAVGGYGRRELFPHSDVDLLFVLDGKLTEAEAKDAIRRVGQAMWDCGIRVSPATRRLAECEKFAAENTEFTISLLDHHYVTGDHAVYEKLTQHSVPKLLQKERDHVLASLVELTRTRHAKYGGTLFHLEPSIKDTPGGLRDVHVCRWIAQLECVGTANTPVVESPEFVEAVEFLCQVRCFLHYRHDRDDNVLDWQTQDAAAARSVGLDQPSRRPADAAYWMRVYFRHARSIERQVKLRLEESTPPEKPRARFFGLAGRRRQSPAQESGFRIDRGVVVIDPPGLQDGRTYDPACDPEVMLRVCAAMARTGCRLGREAEARLTGALPIISAHIEEGPALWLQLQAVLLEPHAGEALRSMHALGVLELLIPEFHGIDALVIRDAYHRYTVDEHTFVLIDTLHGLLRPQPGAMGEWAGRFGSVLRELPHPGLLYLVALLHDTGKGRNTGDHAEESARMARNVLRRLELDAYECELVLGTIQNHLEMSAALRRDVFDGETVEHFAGKVMTPEALRMLTLFTYADINAVHPDALTPWKAENLWQLYVATSNFLDRNVDDERLGAWEESETVHRVKALLPGQEDEVAAFLEGFPQRYVLTRTPEQVREDFLRSQRFAEDTVQLEFRYSPSVCEITLVTRDRALLFANMAGALAAWGMNIVTADAYSNRQWVVVDTFRFTDSFRTLELNASERERFVKSVHDVLIGAMPVDKLLSGRKRARRKAPKVVVDSKLEFDNESSSYSTLLEVIAQDTPGLLRALSLTLGNMGYNIEVALVDTEGETAIDVFYVTRNGAKLNAGEQLVLRRELLRAMEENAGA
ncbi:MAG: [protein-PII] uridylyltransferase [Acidobacteriota bacterium]|nr:[protein-PII] uridylyltransferase [Acidobacteriota bacterium]